MRERALRLVALAVALVGLASTAHAQTPYSVSLFARVPPPGQPEGIAVSPTDGMVYVGTNPNAPPVSSQPPSKVFAFAPDGTLQKEWTISGQDKSTGTYGLYGLAFDGNGFLYALDRSPPRVIRLDPRTGEQRDYARFPDIPPCASARAGECSNTVSDQAPFPNYPAFGPDGTLYVTDALQAALWRVPPAGGRPRLLFTDPRLESAVAGPNGLWLSPDARTLTFAQSNFPPGPTPERVNGRIYTLPLEPGGRAGRLSLLWEGRPFDVPDGFAVGRSGDLYVALSGPDQMLVLSPTGHEIVRVPGNEIENQQQEVPFDKPASVAFLGEQALVTNQSLFERDPSHWAVLSLFAGEEGQPLFHPALRG